MRNGGMGGGMEERVMGDGRKKGGKLGEGSEVKEKRKRSGGKEGGKVEESREMEHIILSFFPPSPVPPPSFPIASYFLFPFLSHSLLLFPPPTQ